MKIIESPLEAYALVNAWRADGQQVGFVPTMGALHEGHLSLVGRSRQECGRTAVSIFVNPTQFGPNEDFSRYPRTFDQDCKQLHELGVDVVFAPSGEQLYPQGFSTYVEPPAAARTLEGEFRPGHFRGVTTIVMKLFQIVPAQVAYFGRKDYQQWTVIRRMVDDLNVPIRVEGCETIREPDGLAMSSRNRYLNQDQREAALSLWKTLTTARKMIESGERNASKIESTMQQTLYSQGAERIDYARIVNPDSLEAVGQVDSDVIAIIAAHVGKTRLIDNLLIEVNA